MIFKTFNHQGVKGSNQSTQTWAFIWKTVWTRLSPGTGRGRARRGQSSCCLMASQPWKDRRGHSNVHWPYTGPADKDRTEKGAPATGCRGPFGQLGLEHGHAHSDAAAVRQSLGIYYMVTIPKWPRVGCDEICVVGRYKYFLNLHPSQKTNTEKLSSQRHTFLDPHKNQKPLRLRGYS